MFDPKITVITPSLNQGKYLESTICSVLDQKYSNLEYMVIDGGSNDGSIDIIKKYQRHINYWVSEPDCGQSEAINKGLIRSTGEFITWINSDDMLEPGILPKIPAHFNRASIGLIFGRSISFGNNFSEKLSNFDFDNFYPKLLGKITFPQPASFFRREVLDRYGLLDESLHYGMDYDLFVRITLNYEVVHFDEIVSRNRFHSDSKSVSQVFKFALDWARVFSKILRSFNFTEDLITDLKALSIYDDNVDYYEISRVFNKCDIETAYIYFLQEQAQLYYGAYKLDKAQIIVKRIMQLNSSFYLKYRLNSIHFRSRYVPAPALRLLKFMRSKFTGQQNVGW
jgi:glycosyltransferase involved in cell wall biosynthesis